MMMIASTMPFMTTMLLLLPTTLTSLLHVNNAIINHLLNRPHLTQSYYALRHGQSLANVAKIISSDPQISTVQHGLSEVGREQAKLAGEQFFKNYYNNNNNNNERYDEGVAIFSSDFQRAKETASLFAQSLIQQQQQQQLPSSPVIPIYQNEIILNTSLRERYFGTLNGGSDTQYQAVWDVDCTNPNHTEFDVECANDVLERTTRLIVELDDMLSFSSTSSSTTTTTGSDGEQQQQTNNKKWKVILVAHGDVLQIMQTGFLRHEDASRHRSLEHLETATIRELKLL